MEPSLPSIAPWLQSPCRRTVWPALLRASVHTPRLPAFPPTCLPRVQRVLSSRSVPLELERQVLGFLKANYDLGGDGRDEQLLRQLPPAIQAQVCGCRGGTVGGGAGGAVKSRVFFWCWWAFGGNS